MELVWGTKEFVVAGHPYQGFPILLWDSMESCTQANQFFRHYLLRGDIGSKESWPSTGRALYDFFSFLQAHACARIQRTTLSFWCCGSDVVTDPARLLFELTRK